MQDRDARTARTAELIQQLLGVVRELEAMHPGRKFPLDGHLVGSIGEAAAEAMFKIELLTASTPGHDAIADDGRKVEIKATFGTRSVAIRATSNEHAGAALIVLKLSKDPGTAHEVWSTTGRSRPPYRSQDRSRATARPSCPSPDSEHSTSPSPPTSGSLSEATNALSPQVDHPTT